jgi:hypothetical protein
MGMYDNLSIKTEKLPISDKDKKRLGNRVLCQTKDLDNLLSNYEITDKNKLKK